MGIVSRAAQSPEVQGQVRRREIGVKFSFLLPPLCKDSEVGRWRKREELLMQWALPGRGAGLGKRGLGWPGAS